MLLPKSSILSLTTSTAIERMQNEPACSDPRSQQSRASPQATRLQTTNQTLCAVPMHLLRGSAQTYPQRKKGKSPVTLSFHNDPSIKEFYVTRAKEHYAADEIVK